MERDVNCFPVFDREIASIKDQLLSVTFANLVAILNDEKKTYLDKLHSLLSVWEQLAFLVADREWRSPGPAFESLFLRTLKFVMIADWLKVSVAAETHLKVLLQRFANAVSGSQKHQCRVLASIVEQPWSNPILLKIIGNEEVEFFDLLEYFQFENGPVIVMRLEVLLEAQCEDLALRLSKSCLSTYHNSEPLELDFNQDELDYILDIYFCTLFQKKLKKELTAEIKVYELDAGVDLLKRYKRNGGVGRGFNDRCVGARVWQHSDEVVELIADALLANAVLHDELIDSDTILPDLISVWASIYEPEEGQKLSRVALEMMGKLVLIASTSRCIYPFCSFVIENGDYDDVNVNVTKWLIRAISTNMNEVEQSRDNQQYDDLKLAYERLAEGFIMISKLFSNCKNIYKECLLTAFSLTPTREGLQKLETLAFDTSAEPQNAAVPTKMKEIFDAPKNVVETVRNECISTGEPAYYAELENLAMEESVKLDLNTILQYQRWNSLSWDLDWSELKKNCERYFNEVQTSVRDVELKYLKLDYNQFKDKPINEEEYIGIEKGYEQFMVTDDRADAKNETFDGSTTSFDDTDKDEDYVLQKRKTQTRKRKKNKNKLRCASSDFNNWENIMEFPSSPGDMKMTIRRRKRKASVLSSDSETSSKKSVAMSDDANGDVYKVCIPELPLDLPGSDYETLAAKRSLSSLHGKRLTMRISLPKALEARREQRVRKPKVVKTVGNELNEALRSVLDTFDSADISSPATHGSSSQKPPESETDPKPDGDDAIQSFATVTESDMDGTDQSRLMESQFGDEAATPTIKPIIIRRQVVEEKREKSSRRKKRKKKVVYTTVKSPKSRTRVKRFSARKVSTRAGESNADPWNLISGYDWDPKYTPLFFTPIESGTNE